MKWLQFPRPTQDSHFLYGTDGQLLAELDAAGNTQREYLYLHAEPVALVSYTPAVPAGSGTVGTALLAGDAAGEADEDYSEVAETAPVEVKPTPATSAPAAGAASASDRAADGVSAVATITPAIQLHYLHPDHLGTPRIATDSTQRIVWRWDSAPFGDSPAQEDPDGDGVRFTLNLRFPGQYFDAETGLHYNYFRDCYDPATGRYCQPDPIGLAGGLNVYTYVENGPLRYSDPRGLSPCKPPAALQCAMNCNGVGKVVEACDEYGWENIAYFMVCKCRANTSCPKWPGNDPTKGPAGTEWKGRPGSKPGGKEGNYHNPNTGESYRPDLEHGDPVGPHWDYKDPNGQWHRVFPDGSVVPK